MSNLTDLPAAAARWWLIGCGDVGLRLARRLGAESVWGFKRQPLRVLPNPAFQWFRLDLDQPLTPLSSPAQTHIIYLAPPPAEGVTDARMARFLQALPPTFTRFVYVSTTAVYGDQRGERVDETTACTPTSDRGQRRLDAERLLQSYCQQHAREWSILRVAGIYGPHRLPIARLKAKQPLPQPQDLGPGNRIHVEDLVSALHLLAEHPAAANEIFNLSDQNHVTSSDFLLEVARQLNLAVPELKPLAELAPSFSPQQQSFMSERRRVDAGKIQQRLGFTPQYADYRQGIAQSLAATPL